MRSKAFLPQLLPLKPLVIHNSHPKPLLLFFRTKKTVENVSPVKIAAKKDDATIVEESPVKKAVPKKKQSVKKEEEEIMLPS